MSAVKRKKKEKGTICTHANTLSFYFQPSGNGKTSSGQKVDVFVLVATFSLTSPCSFQGKGEVKESLQQLTLPGELDHRLASAPPS